MGPWIEKLEEATYRISPPLKAADNVWASQKVQQLRVSAAEALAKQRQITPLEGASGLLLALSSQDRHVLSRWLYGLLNTPADLLLLAKVVHQAHSRVLQLDKEARAE